MLRSQDLHQGWILRPDPDGLSHDGAEVPIDSGLPAEVPGCVHTDLLAAGVIDDPFAGDNEATVSWVARCDWRYDTRIETDSAGHERTDLVFDGLDTVADILLDDRPLGGTRNMHRQYRFDVTDGLGQGAGDLSVRFTSAYTEAERERDRLGDLPNAYPEPFNFVRKMACSFGWDWGPTLPTAGIWRPVRLEHWSTARLASVRPLATIAEGGSCLLTVVAAVERAASGRGRVLNLRVEVDTDTGTAVAQTVVPAEADEIEVRLPVADVRPWWPRSRGEQPRYDCRILLEDQGRALDEHHHRAGFRKVAVDTTDGAFTMSVNDEPIFVRGVNWIPEDVFPSQVTRQRYRHRLTDAAEAGVDLVRVWGGGIYESDDFYDICDELGLLVWQDFPFACAAYPEEEPHRLEVEAEARQAVARLSGHPSLVLWNGNNENLWGYVDWGWRESLEGRSWGEGYYLKLLPAIVAELDPTRPYTAGSPWSGGWGDHPNAPEVGTHHSWEVWNRLDYGHYRDSAPRFVAEFGWQAPPVRETFRSALGEEHLRLDSPVLAAHQKAADGQGKLARGLAHHFVEPRDFDAWHYLTQLNQVRAVRTGVEHWRSLWPHCAGTILWQLNDCWPVISWSAVDGDGRRKPLWYGLRDCYRSRLLTIQPRLEQRLLVAVNNSASPWRGMIGLGWYASSGRRLDHVDIAFDVAPGMRWEYAIPDGWTGHEGRFLVADESEQRASWFDESVRCPQPRAEYTTNVVEVDGGFDVTVTSSSVTRDLLLQSDRIDPQATVDRGFVTLLPGESVTYAVRSPVELDPAALSRPYVLTSLDEVLAGEL